MTDHLWPARAEYLRGMVRGAYRSECGDLDAAWLEAGQVRDGGAMFTPAWTGRVDEINGVHAHGGDDDGWWTLDTRDTYLDLRDATARAHAAWAYTTRFGGDLIDALYGAMADDMEGTKAYKGVLLMAAHGYEPSADDLSDFIALLRAALAWAERVIDGI